MSQTINNYVLECPELADHFDYNDLITAVADCELSVGQTPPAQENTPPLDDYWQEWQVEISNPYWKKHADGQTVLCVNDNSLSTTQLSTQKFFRNLFGLINTEKFYMPIDAWICKKPIDTWVRPHVDGHRTVALMFPITPLSYTTTFSTEGLKGDQSWKKLNQSEGRQASENVVDQEWHDQTWGEVLYEHTYKPMVPTMFNSKILHSVLDYKQQARTVFQISIYFKSQNLVDPQDDDWDGWSEFVDYYKSGKLFKI
jgi:hypothetical protein